MYPDHAVPLLRFWSFVFPCCFASSR